MEVRQRYIAEIRNSALVAWRLPDAGIGGVRAGIDEVAWHDADIAYFQTSFSRPAKSSGYVHLEARCHHGTTFPILSSDHHDSTIHEWHLAAAAQIARLYPGFTRIRDGGCDA